MAARDLAPGSRVAIFFSRIPFGSVACSSRKLVILFVVTAAAVIVLWLGGIVSVVCSIVLSKDCKSFMWDLTRAFLSSFARRTKQKRDYSCSLMKDTYATIKVKVLLLNDYLEKGISTKSKQKCLRACAIRNFQDKSANLLSSFCVPPSASLSLEH